MKLSKTKLNTILACPSCKSAIGLPEVGKHVVCETCGDVYEPLAYSWNMIPSQHRQMSSTLWNTWKKLENNQKVAYHMDPEHNLSIGKRKDVKDFATFCKFKGLVLDVGCGPQPWPAYFGYPSTEVYFIGVDPLAGNVDADYIKFRAFGEYLPFQEKTFDHIVFATSLDHMVDPLVPLTEAKRVCKMGGQVNIWIHEKKRKAPRIEHSPEWYERLEHPTHAVDAFRFARITFNELKSLLQRVEMKLNDWREVKVDEYQTTFFVRAIN
jgi:ubiquinone/menaquinone biosynthesis C-methylase UbiE/uncharacterized protein YbaR (Trm112 family)